MIELDWLVQTALLILPIAIGGIAAYVRVNQRLTHIEAKLNNGITDMLLHLVNEGDVLREKVARVEALLEK